MKKLLKISILLLLFVPWQCAIGQQIIIMGSEGSNMFVGGIDENPSYFYDPGGIPGTPGVNNDPNGYFAQGLRDTITLRTSANTARLYVLFEEFVMGPGDTLWIFDGSSVNAPLLGNYNLARSPGEITASGRDMTFVFQSDSIDIPGLMSGWRVTVNEYNPNPEIVKYGEYGVLTTCNARFYDSGGPSGKIIPNNANFTEFTAFTSPVGTHIKCEFTQFSVNGILKIYDGRYDNPAERRLIGQFCTSTLDSYTNDMPPKLFSSTNTLSFVYVNKPGDQSMDGWAAEISCVPEIVETPTGTVCPEIVNIPGGEYEGRARTRSDGATVIEYDCSKPVVVLKAKLIGIPGGVANDYKVELLPYDEADMLFSYDQGTPVDANTDDNWITNQALGFTFTFFGRNYTNLYPGANGLVSFNEQDLNSSTACSWSTSVPPDQPPYGNPKPYNFVNSVYGVYEDINPRSTSGMGSFCPNNISIKYGVLGIPPCRAFVFNYYHIGSYECCNCGESYYNTYQMVLYEGTNIIDIFVKHRKRCTTSTGCSYAPWNNGHGVIGLQNKTSSQILTAPGHDFNTEWDADNEHWRFTPISPRDENAVLTWYKNSVNDANKLYTTTNPYDTIYTIVPDDTTVIISEYKYLSANGTQYSIYDSTIINVNIPKLTPASSNGNTPVCPGDSVFLTVEIDPSLNIGAALYGGYTWSSSKKDTFAIDTVCAPVGIDTATYYVTVKFENSCTRRDSVKVAITELVMPTITGRNAVSDTDSICLGKSYTLEATHPDTNKFKWSTVADNTIFNDKDTVITVSPQITTDYVATATMVGDCDVSDTFTVVVMPLPQPSFTAYPTEIFVENGIGSVQCTNTSDDYPQLIWNFGDAFSNVNIIQDLNEPTHDYTRSGFYTITMTAIDTFGCVDSVKARVSVKVPYFFYIPNAFTPDGDGLNERFAPQGEGVDPDNYSMQIFDRSGLLIFSTRNPYDYWDGRNKHGQMCPEGVYVYKIKLVNLNGDEMEYPGTVTLVR